MFKEREKEKLGKNEKRDAALRIMLTIFGAIAEFERDLMLQRQREGIRIAQAAGKYKGRHEKKPPNDFDDYRKL